MGTVVRFPGAGRATRAAGRSIEENADSAIVIILPVVRIERYSDAPSEREPGPSQRRRRRRRAART
jgi:hypothetical protein